MNALKLLLPIALTSVASLSAQSIEYSFSNIEEYTDFSLNGRSEEFTQKIFEDALERKSSQLTHKGIPQNAILHIEFTNIDMAGDIQSWRNPNNADIRYVEDVYPPRLEFNYTLKSESGEIIKEGQESIKDLNFLWDVGINKTDSFYYEIELLKNWIAKLDSK